jgi:hypothetical protein
MCTSILDSQFAGHVGRVALADIVINIKNRPLYRPLFPFMEEEYEGYKPTRIRDEDNP